MEEVNLSIELGEVHHIYSHTYNHHEGFEVHFWQVEYMVKLAAKEDIKNLKLSRDHDEYKFVDIEEAKTLQKMHQDKRGSLLAALTARL